MNNSANASMINTLKAEHRHMANVLNLLKAQLDEIEAGELSDPHVLYEILDYITAWPDRYHHPREDIIYSRVAELDAKAADDVDTLQRDHDVTAKKGKKLLSNIVRWQIGELSAKRLLKEAHLYVDHIFEHMNVEEKVVFPHIESVLSEKDWLELAEEDSLVAVNTPLFGAPVQREFRKMTRRLRRSTRTAVNHAALTQWVGVETAMESAEVLSFALACAKDSVGDRVGSAINDSISYFQNQLVTAPARCAVNNIRVSLAICGDIASISRETASDLGEIRKSHKERMQTVLGDS